jgi:hypothetical protein
MTYGCILAGFCTTTLECNPVTLVLEALRGDETLDAWGLGVWLLALALWLHFTTDDILADLKWQRFCQYIAQYSDSAGGR